MKQVVLLFILLITTISVKGQEVPKDGLSAHYSFDDGTGTDLVGKNNAIFKGGVTNTKDRFGNEGKAKRLDGDLNTYISLGNSAAVKPLNGTISIWVNIESINKNGNGFPFNPIILAKNANSPNSFMEAYCMYVQMLDDKKIGITTGGKPNKQSLFRSAAPLKLQEWYHLVLVYDKEQMRGYLNGVLVGKESTGYEPSFSKEDVVVGNTLNVLNNRALDGAVDDIRIYDRVLKEEEIVSLFKAPNPVISIPVPLDAGESPCKAKWNLSNANNSSLVIEPNGFIKKVSHDGSNKVESENILAEGENGWMKFKVKKFGKTKKGKDGRIKIGATINGKDYQFNIAPNREKHQIIIDGESQETFQAVFKEGTVVQIKRTGGQLVLRQKGEKSMETVTRIKKIGTGKTQFFIKINGLSAVIAQTKMSYSLGCPPYASLKNQLDGSFVKQTDNILRFKFDQQYAVEATTQYLDIPYTIYNWKRVVAQTGIIRVYQGMNWENIKLTGLLSEEFYTLEFRANKEEQYLLRFKTK